MRCLGVADFIVWMSSNSFIRSWWRIDVLRYVIGLPECLKQNQNVRFVTVIRNLGTGVSSPLRFVLSFCPAVVRANHGKGTPTVASGTNVGARRRV